jgi:hypothetical protein
MAKTHQSADTRNSRCLGMYESVSASFRRWSTIRGYRDVAPSASSLAASQDAKKTNSTAAQLPIADNNSTHPAANTGFPLSLAFFCPLRFRGWVLIRLLPGGSRVLVCACHRHLCRLRAKRKQAFSALQSLLVFFPSFLGQRPGQWYAQGMHSRMASFARIMSKLESIHVVEFVLQPRKYLQRILSRSRLLCSYLLRLKAVVYHDLSSCCSRYSQCAYRGRRGYPCRVTYQLISRK